MNLWPFIKREQHNPGRELALIGADQRRRSWVEKRNAVAQQLRAEKGLPPHPALSIKAN